MALAVYKTDELTELFANPQPEDPEWMARFRNAADRIWIANVPENGINRRNPGTNSILAGLDVYCMAALYGPWSLVIDALDAGNIDRDMYTSVFNMAARGGALPIIEAMVGNEQYGIDSNSISRAIFAACIHNHVDVATAMFKLLPEDADLTRFSAIEFEFTDAFIPTYRQICRAVTE